MSQEREQPAVEVVPIESLTPDAANVVRRDEKARRHLAASLKQFGPARSIVLDGKGIVRAGNGTLEAAQEAGVSEVLVIKPKPGQLVAVQREDWSASEATGYAIADNRIGDLKTYDETALAEQLHSLAEEGFDYEPMGFTLDEVESLVPADSDSGDNEGGSGESSDSAEPASRPSLADRFIVPPFSVLDASQGYWQERKRAWIALGIKGELGRGGIS